MCIWKINNLPPLNYTGFRPKESFAVVSGFIPPRIQHRNRKISLWARLKSPSSVQGFTNEYVAVNFCRQTLVQWNFIILVNEASGAGVRASFLMSLNEEPNLWQQWAAQQKISCLAQAFISSILRVNIFSVSGPGGSQGGPSQMWVSVCFLILLICEKAKASIKGLFMSGNKVIGVPFYFHGSFIF